MTICNIAQYELQAGHNAPLWCSMMVQKAGVQNGGYYYRALRRQNNRSLTIM